MSSSYSKPNRQPRQRNAQQALETLQWLCSRMERSESDIRRSLYRWSVPKKDWDGVIEKLKKDGFVDNQRYANAYVREKASLSNWGTVKIIHALRVKGVAEELIDRAIAENVQHEVMIEKLDKFIQERIKRDSSKAKNVYDLQGKVFRAAASRGFNFEQIKELIQRYIKDVEF